MEDRFFNYDNSSVIKGMQKEKEECGGDSFQKRKRGREKEGDGGNKNNLNATDVDSSDDRRHQGK